MLPRTRLGWFDRCHSNSAGIGPLALTRERARVRMAAGAAGRQGRPPSLVIESPKPRAHLFGAPPGACEPRQRPASRHRYPSAPGLRSIHRDLRSPRDVSHLMPGGTRSPHRGTHSLPCGSRSPHRGSRSLCRGLRSPRALSRSLRRGLRSPRGGSHALSRGARIPAPEFSLIQNQLHALHQGRAIPSPPRACPSTWNVFPSPRHAIPRPRIAFLALAR